MFNVDELFSKRNQRDAMKHFMNAKDGICADGLRVSELEEFWTLNSERIITEVQMCIYEPGIIKNSEIINGRGKKRTISNLPLVDRFITRLLAQKLARYFNPLFMENSFAYQEGKGVLEAVLHLIKKYLFCRISTDGSVEDKQVGLVQGNVISPVLSNLYLNQFDMVLEFGGYSWIRFADNVYIL